MRHQLPLRRSPTGPPKPCSGGSPQPSRGSTSYQEAWLRRRLPSICKLCRCLPDPPPPPPPRPPAPPNTLPAGLSPPHLTHAALWLASLRCIAPHSKLCLQRCKSRGQFSLYFVIFSLRRSSVLTDMLSCGHCLFRLGR